MTEKFSAHLEERLNQLRRSQRITVIAVLSNEAMDDREKFGAQNEKILDRLRPAMQRLKIELIDSRLLAGAIRIRGTAASIRRLSRHSAIKGFLDPNTRVHLIEPIEKKPA